MFNLVYNSLDSFRNQTLSFVQPFIWIWIIQHESGLEIICEDNGPGLQKHHLLNPTKTNRLGLRGRYFSALSTIVGFGGSMWLRANGFEILWD